MDAPETGPKAEADRSILTALYPVTAGEGEHLLDLYQVATAYVGGSALDLTNHTSCGFALALAGIKLTTYFRDRDTMEFARQQFQQHCLVAAFELGDGLREFDHPGTYDVVFYDAPGENVRVPEVEAFWMHKLNAGGVLIVIDTAESDHLALVDALHPDQAFPTRDRSGCRTSYYFKSASEIPVAIGEPKGASLDWHAIARQRYLLRVGQVDGWLAPTSAHLIDHLLQEQSKLGVSANVMEIGVHHGKLFLILALGVMQDEYALAVDLFQERQGENIDRSGSGNRQMLEQNLARFAPHANVRSLQANSLELGEDFFDEHSGMRFVSVDGGHTRQATDNDLRVAEAVVLDGAIVAVDDIYSFYWSGVTAGMARYFFGGGKLIPFAIGSQKCYLTTSQEFKARYQDVIRAFLPKQRLAKLEFFEFDNVLQVRNEERFKSDAWMLEDRPE